MPSMSMTQHSLGRSLTNDNHIINQNHIIKKELEAKISTPNEH